MADAARVEARLEAERQAWERGDRAAPLRALHDLASHQAAGGTLPMPHWLAERLVLALGSWARLESPTLDDAFRVPPAKHISALRRKRRWLSPVLVRLYQLREQRGSRLVGDRDMKALFDRVAQELAAVGAVGDEPARHVQREVSAAIVRDWWFEHRRESRK